MDDPRSEAFHVGRPLVLREPRGGHRLRIGRHGQRAEGGRSARRLRLQRAGVANLDDRHPGRIQPIDTQIARDAGTSTTTTRYRIFVEENLDLDHTCCIRGPDGAIYTITGTIGAERIGELQTINVELSWSSSGQ